MGDRGALGWRVPCSEVDVRAPSDLIRDRHPGTAALWMAFATLLACGVAGPVHAQQIAPATSSEMKSQADNDPPKPASPQGNMRYAVGRSAGLWSARR